MQKAHIFSGNSNRALAEKITTSLNVELSPCSIRRFSDGEIGVNIETNVRGQYTFVIQSTCAPSNDNLMELLIMIDALRRSAADRIIAVIPYYGYARQDRRPGYERSSISSKLIANMLTKAGIDQIITLDIHSTQQQGFFDLPFTDISASPEIISDILRLRTTQIKRLVIVSPDVGGVSRARYIAKRADNADLAIVDKRRERANESEVMNVIGNIEGANCVMVDDMIDTAGTLCKAAKALKLNGASTVTAYATHAVFSGSALNNIKQSVLDQVVVTDTIPLSPAALDLVEAGKIRVISAATLIAETMRRVSSNQSVSEIYT